MFVTIVAKSLMEEKNIQIIEFVCITIHTVDNVKSFIKKQIVMIVIGLLKDINAFSALR